MMYKIISFLDQPFMEWSENEQDIFRFVEALDLDQDSEAALWRYLGRRGHVNAQFSEEEMRRLGYPKMGSVAKYENTYIRQESNVAALRKKDAAKSDCKEAYLEFVSSNYLRLLSYSKEIYFLEDNPNLRTLGANDFLCVRLQDNETVAEAEERVTSQIGESNVTRVFYHDDGKGLPIIICEKIKSLLTVRNKWGYRIDPLVVERHQTQRKTPSSNSQNEAPNGQDIHTKFTGHANWIKSVAEDINTPKNKAIYFKALDQFIRKLDLRNSEHPAITFVRYQLLQCLKQSSLSLPYHHFIRVVQDAFELVILAIDLLGPRSDLKEVLNLAYFGLDTSSGLSEPHVYMAPYGMRSFTWILQSLIKNPKGLSISCMNQSYFELIESVFGLDNRRNSVRVSNLQTLDSVPEDVDLIFSELHPNNVSASRQEATTIADVEKLFKKWEGMDRKRTLVLDLTCTSLLDDDVPTLLEMAAPLIANGTLNLVIVQSLTKYVQLGLDLIPAGLVMTFNSSENDWGNFNNKLRDELVCKEERATIRETYFLEFLRDPSLVKDYMDLLNSHTQEMYHGILASLDRLEVPAVGRVFEILTSSDDGAPYVALKFDTLQAYSDSPNNPKDTQKKLSKFGTALLNEFMVELADILDVPLTHRWSIGFPLSSMNDIWSRFRFTVGLEPEEVRKKYVQLLSYTAFVLNRQPSEVLSKLLNDEGYRQQFFKEKVAIFRAVMADGEISFPKPLDAMPNVTRTINVCKDGITVDFTPIQGIGETTIPKEAVSAWMHVNGERKDWHVMDIPPFERACVAACLTNLERTHTVKLLQENGGGFDSDRTVPVTQPTSLSFSSFHILSHPVDMRFGPFKQKNKETVTFELSNGKLSVLNKPGDETAYTMDDIIVCRYGQSLPMSRLSLTEQLNFLTSICTESSFLRDEEGGIQRSFKPVLGLSIRYKGGQLRLSNQRSYSVGNRPLRKAALYFERTGDHTLIRPDFWSEKRVPQNLERLDRLFRDYGNLERHVPFEREGNSFKVNKDDQETALRQIYGLM